LAPLPAEYWIHCGPQKFLIRSEIASIRPGEEFGRDKNKENVDWIWEWPARYAPKQGMAVTEWPKSLRQ
jgi:hypothetical protein